VDTRQAAWQQDALDPHRERASQRVLFGALEPFDQGSEDAFN
jgi:hypothetical protein